MIRDKLNTLKEKLETLVKLKDKPRSIALGAAIGLFWNFIPSLGIGPILSLILARLLKGSSIAAVTINIATGFFIPLFYTLNVIVGNALIGIGIGPFQEQIGSSFEQSVGNIGNVIDEPKTYFLISKLQSFSKEFFLGSLVNAFLAAVVFYFILYLILSKRKKYIFVKKNKRLNNTQK